MKNYQCDKCRGLVRGANSRIRLEKLGDKPVSLPPLSDRHLYPEEKYECEGSPAIVKLIETNEYWREVYLVMLQLGAS
jgi:hypothetical protein